MLVIKQYEDLKSMVLRNEKELVGKKLNMREFLELKDVVTIKNLIDKVGFINGDDYIAVPYLLGDYYTVNNSGDLENTDGTRYLLMIHNLKGGILCKIVAIDDSYDYIGEHSLGSSTRVDEFVADYILAKFRQGWIEHQKFQKRMGILKIKGIMDKNKISMDDVKNYNFSDYCGN